MNVNGQDQRNNQLTIEEVKKILDLPESAFLEEGDTNINGSIGCSSYSFTDTPSEMELDSTQGLKTEFPQPDFHSQELCFTDSKSMLKTTLVQKEAKFESNSMFGNLECGTGYGNLENSETNMNLNIINPKSENRMRSNECITNSNNSIIHQNNIKAPDRNHQEVKKVHKNVPEFCTVCQAQALKYPSYG